MCFLFFYSTFSLSSHRFNPCSLSLSSLDQIPSPLPIPHGSSRCHRLWFEDSIATDLKSPSPLPIWSSLIWSYIFLHTLAIDGWLSLVIDWSIGLGFCWRFWVFIYLLRFLDLKFVGGFSNCGCSLWRWLLLWWWLLVLGWWRLPLGCAFVYLLGFE